MIETDFSKKGDTLNLSIKISKKERN